MYKTTATNHQHHKIGLQSFEVGTSDDDDDDDVHDDDDVGMTTAN